MSISKIIGTFTAAFIAVIAATLLSTSHASAWSVQHSAASECRDEEAVITWSFKNTEPNQAKWSIDLEVTNSENDLKITETVAPGETATGFFGTNETKIDAGKVTFTMLWTDGRRGVDVRTSSYAMTEECYVEREEPAFNAAIICEIVDAKAVFTLNIEQTAGETPGVFTPANGTVLENGNAVEVLGVFDNGEVKITQTAQAAEDCTPEEETEKVCRDGKIVEIEKSDRKETDTDTCPQVSSVVKELPKTGPASMIAAIAAVFATSVAGAQLHMRRK